MNIQKKTLSDLSVALPDSYDLFICSSSFEKRCLSIAERIEKAQVRRALILSNEDLLEFVQENMETLSAIFGERGRSVKISTKDPLITADSIDENLVQAISDKCVNTILLDVTTFTHESLLIMLRLLKLRCSSSRITYIYANAREYSVGDDLKHKWLSRGIREVRSVLGYPGNILPSRKTHLIVILGYEFERADALIETLEPHSIALGYGRSGQATTEKDTDANEHYLHLLKQLTASYSNVDTFEIPCDDPYGTRDEIERQIIKAQELNIVLAPMNNKLSTIGAAWAGFDNEDVQICYPQALRYNYFNYSTPGNYCYFFDAD